MVLRGPSPVGEESSTSRLPEIMDVTGVNTVTKEDMRSKEEEEKGGETPCVLGGKNGVVTSVINRRGWWVILGITDTPLLVCLCSDTVFLGKSKIPMV